MRWCAITLVFAACGAAPSPRRANEDTPAEQLRMTLARANIQLRLGGRVLETRACRPDPPSGVSTCTRCEPVAHAGSAVLASMTKEFARYPSKALAAARIDHVALCRDLVMTRRNEEVDRPIAVADPYGRGLLINASRLQDPSVPWYDQLPCDQPVGDVVHHELYHLLENTHTRALMTFDPEWDALNLLGFSYTSANLGDGVIPGFWDTYAMTHVAEDKATVFSMLMSNPKHLCELAKTDEVLRKKVALVWRRVRTMMGTDQFMRTTPCLARLAGA